MEQWVVVYIASRVSEVHVMQAILAQHGIENRLRDENLIQAQPFYSNAVGGVKVEVRLEDAEQAVAILRNGGYTPEPISEDDPEAARARLVQADKRFWRRIKIVGGIAVVCIIVAFILTFPEERVDPRFKVWCVRSVQSLGVHSRPDTKSAEGITIELHGCEESVYFNDDGTVTLPGFDSPAVNAFWQFTETGIEIYGASDYTGRYNDVYDLEQKGASLRLISDRTIISLEEFSVGIPNP
ncbi:MAG: hypothetical protein ACK500_03095 [Flavobacteriales bacterium]